MRLGLLGYMRVSLNSNPTATGTPYALPILTVSTTNTPYQILTSTNNYNMFTA